jgi:hypothetical protein
MTQSHTRVRATGSAGWTTLPISGQLPPPRSQFGLAADGSGNVYLYGGSGTGNVALSDFWVLQPARGTWQQLPNTVLPPLIEPHLAVDAQDDVFELGGIGNAASGHFSYDGHSFGLYEYTPASGLWVDRTPADVQPGVTWPGGREDFGLTFDLSQNLLYVFAGEGNADIPLNDLWSYNPVSGTWTQIDQHYNAPHGATIDPREIYNISYDYHGGLYLFGGSYLTPPTGAAAPPLYVNDLWRFDIATATWSLLGGTANDYNPALPIPRHYYGQACDGDGNFYLLDGYASDTSTLPFFRNDQDGSAARVVTLDGSSNNTVVEYAIADFWQYSAATRRWHDLSSQLGVLFDQPAIPYVMVADPRNEQLLTFGGFHPAGETLLRGNSTWVFSLPQPALPTATVPPAATGSQTPDTLPNDPTAIPVAVATSTAASLLIASVSPAPRASTTPTSPSPRGGRRRNGANPPPRNEQPEQSLAGTGNVDGIIPRPADDANPPHP